jgi:hypothetical protein
MVYWGDSESAISVAASGGGEYSKEVQPIYMCNSATADVTNTDDCGLSSLFGTCLKDGQNCRINNLTEDADGFFNVYFKSAPVGGGFGGELVATMIPSKIAFLGDLSVKIPLNDPLEKLWPIFKNEGFKGLAFDPTGVSDKTLQLLKDDGLQFYAATQGCDVFITRPDPKKPPVKPQELVENIFKAWQGFLNHPILPAKAIIFDCESAGQMTKVKPPQLPQFIYPPCTGDISIDAWFKLPSHAAALKAMPIIFVRDSGTCDGLFEGYMKDGYNMAQLADVYDTASRKNLGNCTNDNGTPTILNTMMYCPSDQAGKYPIAIPAKDINPQSVSSYCPESPVWTWFGCKENVCTVSSVTGWLTGQDVNKCLPCNGAPGQCKYMNELPGSASKFLSDIGNRRGFALPGSSPPPGPTPPGPTPPTPGGDECSESFCNANSGANCTASPANNCEYCNKKACHHYSSAADEMGAGF